MVQDWGKRFENEKDILPIFSEVYDGLKAKGVDFPSAPQPVKLSKESSMDKAGSDQVYAASSPAKASGKRVTELSKKNQGIVKEMNLLKGNVNFTNELLDGCKSRDDLKNNDILIDLMKALKEMEPKLISLIQDSDGINEDVLNIVLMVNEDLHLTFDRFKEIKDSKKPQRFVPGECRVQCHYLEPTHQY